MATKEKVKQLRELCEKATSTPVEKLVRNPDWGKINFDAAQSDLERLFWMYRLLLELPVDLVPEADIAPIIAAATGSEKVVDDIRKFSIDEKNQNPSATRDSLVNQVRDHADALTRATNNWIPFLAYNKGDVQRNIALLDGAVTEANLALEAARTEISQKRDELDSIVRAAREASAKAGVAHFTQDFSEEAATSETQAKTWLVWTGGLAIATLVVAVIFAVIPIPSDASQGRLWQLFSSKFVILALMITATIWCGRLYKASKHQAAMNKHRANALKTFQAFVKAASDDQTRDAVLMESTRSIFAITSTGYLDGGEGGGEGVLKVMEVVKSATKMSEGAK